MAKPQTANLSTLGIIAGGGRLPLQLVEACQATGRPFFVLAFDESADIAAISHVPHAVVRLGAVGEALNYLRGADVAEVVMAGKVKRPSFSGLRPDRVGTRLLSRMGGAFFSGDDALLSAIVGFLEEEGFSVLGSDDVLGGLVTPAGLLGKIHPDQRSRSDIAYGMKVIKALGALDIGQAVIVEHGYVLGVEAAEGTDALIERCAPLRREDKGGVLIKAHKPSQETRVDLPAIGPNTVDAIHRSGFAGIAVEAGGSLLLDKDTIIAKADALGIFVMGVTND
jgi:UDP-2,3-diacylglucosamine hydrolase